MPRALACALCILAAALGGAHADPVPTRAPDARELSDLETGRLLLRAGRLEHAHAFLEQARPASEEDRVERLFLLGRIELRLGRPAKAVTRFEAILAMRPGLTRVRLELARAYYLAGLDARARRQLKLSLAHELPSNVEAAVEDFLRRIDADRSWSASVSAFTLPEIRRPDGETVLIGGVPFRLDEEARSSSGHGVLVSGGVSASPRLTETLRGAFAASAATRAYERSSWNETSVSGETGIARLLDRGSVSGGVRMGRVWTDGDPARTTLGPWARVRLRLPGRTQLDVALNASRRRHDTRGAEDGWRLSLAPRLAHTVDARTSFTMEPVVEAVSARERRHASRLLGLGATVSRAFRGGLAATIGVSAQVRRHKAPDPLFGTRRVDHTARVSARLAHRPVRLLGLTFHVGLSLERNRSTMPIHEYRIRGLVAGVSRAL